MIAASASYQMSFPENKMVYISIVSYLVLQYLQVSVQIESLLQGNHSIHSN